jgi:hypothetical protein
VVGLAHELVKSALLRSEGMLYQTISSKREHILIPQISHARHIGACYLPRRNLATLMILKWPRLRLPSYCHSFFSKMNEAEFVIKKQRAAYYSGSLLVLEPLATIVGRRWFEPWLWLLGTSYSG